nr:hypothetical protein [uncultured Roseateles sp.]
MTTKLTQILDRIDVVLKAALAGVCLVFRDRADAQSLEEAPCINVVARDGTTTQFSAEFDQDEQQIELRVYVREEPGTPEAERIHQLAHQALVADAPLKVLLDSLRRTDHTFDPEPADTTSLIKVQRYRALYLTPVNTL